MSVLSSLFLVAVCFPLATQGQSQISAQVPFAGCYRVVSQEWHPVNEDMSPIPDRFQLRSESTDQRSKGIFAMRRIPANGNLMEKLWVWQPKGSRLWISWGTGFGGFSGTLKQSRTGEFVGKVKERCDSHCEWKKRVGKIRIQKTDCAE